MYKAPKAEEDVLAVPEPGSLGSLSYPEFTYVLRARQAAQRAQQAASRSRIEDAWGGDADVTDDQQLHDAEGYDGITYRAPLPVHAVTVS